VILNSIGQCYSVVTPREFQMPTHCTPVVLAPDIYFNKSISPTRRLKVHAGYFKSYYQIPRTDYQFRTGGRVFSSVTLIY
jgi:hypothetical protein